MKYRQQSRICHSLEEFREGLSLFDAVEVGWPCLIGERKIKVSIIWQMERRLVKDQDHILIGSFQMRTSDSIWCAILIPTPLSFSVFSFLFLFFSISFSFFFLTWLQSSIKPFPMLRFNKRNKQIISLSFNIINTPYRKLLTAYAERRKRNAKRLKTCKKLFFKITQKQD